MHTPPPQTLVLHNRPIGGRLCAHPTLPTQRHDCRVFLPSYYSTHNFAASVRLWWTTMWISRQKHRLLSPPHASTQRYNWCSNGSNVWRVYNYHVRICWTRRHNPRGDHRSMLKNTNYQPDADPNTSPTCPYIQDSWFRLKLKVQGSIRSWTFP